MKVMVATFLLNRLSYPPAACLLSVLEAARLPPSSLCQTSDIVL